MMNASRLLACVLLAFISREAHPATLTGRVVDSQEQKVFEAAQVQVEGVAEVLSDRHGFFRIDGLRPGPILVFVRLPDGRQFSARIILRPHSALFAELDHARHAPPHEDDHY